MHDQIIKIAIATATVIVVVWVALYAEHKATYRKRPGKSD